MNLWKKRTVISFLLFAFLFTATGCGYILKPERRTEKLSNTTDTTTIIYDGLWLFCFIVPGVVALAVDATEETWYYTEAELKAREAGR